MKKKRGLKINKLKLGMIFLVFCMSIGFAAVNTRLKINGWSSFAYSEDNDFKVYFSRTFINDVGRSNILNDEKRAFTFSYTDINGRDADLKYTVKNTSYSFFADVEVSCKPRKKDGTKFLYETDNYVSRTFRIEPGKSFTTDLKLLLPETTDSSNTSVLNINLEEYVKSLSSGSDSGIDFNNLNETGVFESTNTNSGKSVYYYRGTEFNNDVIFAEKCWKILRTSENGGVKLLYNGTPLNGSCKAMGASLSIDTEEENVIIKNLKNTYPDNAYAGYMYGNLNATDYDSAHLNLNDSVFKQEIDAWYERHLLNTVYEQYLIDDYYYSNRTVLEDYTGVTRTGEYTTLGYGKNDTLYESAANVSSYSKSLKPSFKYNNRKDVYTKIDVVNGNGDLKYPIGTLTADELIYAGVNKNNNVSSRSWLYTSGRTILTLSPVGYFENSMHFVVEHGDQGYLTTIPFNNGDSLYILPTITLTPDILIYSGDGSSSNPFILSSEDIYENTYTCSLNVSKVGVTEELEPHNPLLDLEIGEEYCFNEECFFTLSNDQKGTIKMIAKYNLYVGNYYESADNKWVISTSDPLYGKQSADAIPLPVDEKVYPHIGGVVYSESKNPSYESSNHKPYVDAYTEYLKEITGLNIKGQLITYDELMTLGCTSSSCKSANWDWVAGRAYWTMTQGPNNSKGDKTLYLVGTDGYFGASTGMNNGEYRGVRPVITIYVPTKNTNVTFVSGNGENVGDEICIDTECFYVLDYDGSNYTLFAKYNLYVGNEYASNSSGVAISTSDPLYGKQNSLAIGDKGSPIYGTVNYSNAVLAAGNYADYMNRTYGFSASGRLITPTELGNLGCDANRYVNDTSDYKNWGCEYPSYSKYSWVLNSTYWVESNSSTMYLVGGDGYYRPLNRTSAQETNAKSRGVRPVLVVPASEIKSKDYVVPTNSYPKSWEDYGVFSDYYGKAYAKLKTMSTEEKVGQLLVATYSNQETMKSAVANYHLGGVLFFESNFTGKTESEVKQMTSGLQASAKIPLMMAADEEGGPVVRIATNLKLVGNEVAQNPELFYTRSDGKNAWKLSRDLYSASGNNFDLIKKETKVKSAVLNRLGINVNFAPVVDMAIDGVYISNRVIGLDAIGTGQYAQAVVETSKGTGVSYSLKHFPGYGNNADTHSTSSVDTKTKEELMNNDVIPFKMGIDAGAEMVMISHNTVASIDANNPASLSYPIHELLFDEVGFTGIAVTDDLHMSAIADNVTNQYIKAFTAGNHILLTSSGYATAYNEILSAVNSGNVPMSDLNKRVFKILAWKYYNGMLI